MSSRKDSIEEHLRKVAKKGGFSSKTPFKIYISEAKRLNKAGLCPLPKEKTKRSYYLNWENPDWNDPCGDGPPLEVLDYIEGNTNIFPYKSCSVLAQELYTIAARANYKKRHKN